MKNIYLSKSVFLNQFLTTKSLARKKFYLIILLIITSIFTGCMDDLIIENHDNTYANIRGNKNFLVELETTEFGTLYKAADLVNVSNVNGYTFIVTLDNTTFFTCISTEIRYDNDSLKIIKNPGQNQIVYNNKSSVEIYAANALLNLFINPDNSTTTATSIIIEEAEGL